MRREFFVAGTDTDVGKTIVAAGLLRAAAADGIRSFGLKPVQTGCAKTGSGEFFAPDVGVYLDACPEGPLCEAEALVCFEPACSPHLAARECGRTLSAADLAGAVENRLAGSPAQFVLVEGAGGVMTPLNERETMLDLMARLAFPVLLVAANRLGAVNHALLSIKAVQSAGLEVAGLVLTLPGRPYGEAGEGAMEEVEEKAGREAGPPKEATEKFRRGASPLLADTPDACEALAGGILSDNPHIIAALSGCRCLAEVPRLEMLGHRTRAGRARAWEALAGHLGPVLSCLREFQPCACPVENTRP